MIYQINSVQRRFTENTVFSIIEGTDVKTGKKYYSISHLGIGHTIELENMLNKFENKIRWNVIRNISGSQAFEYYKRFCNDNFEIIKDKTVFEIKCKILIKNQIKRETIKEVKEKYDPTKLFRDVMPIKLLNQRENILNSIVLYKQNVPFNEIIKKTGITSSTFSSYLKKYKNVCDENPELNDKEVFEKIYSIEKKKMLIGLIENAKTGEEKIDETIGIFF